MMRARLDVVLKLLLSGGAAAAVVPVPGCGGPCADDVVEPEPFELPEDVQIFAATDDGLRYAVGAGGVVMDLFGDGRVDRPVDVDLRAVTTTDEIVVVAGAGGVVAAAALGSDEWQVIDLGTTADLWGAAHVANRTLVVGDGVMFSRDARAGTWTPVPPPEGGWGELRAVGGAGRGHVLAVGRGGVIWFAPEPQGPWQREDAGTDADLTSVYDGLVGGADGLVLARDDVGTWMRLPIDSTSTVLDVHPAVLTAAGEIFELTGDGTTVSRTRMTDPVAGARTLVSGELGTYIVLGEAGSQRQVGRCLNAYVGRPFVVDEAPRIAASVAGDDWCRAVDSGGGPAPEIRAALAEAWTDAALAEHASIASFARAVLELMSLGAPPELLRATQAAIADEVEHAALSFAQARRHGGVARGPGPLAIEHSLGRAGDPVAIASAVLIEGCLGEGVAAAEAAVAADVCADAEARDVLRTIAADEARHAALAWKTLRWLIDGFGETVAAPLRRRLAALGSPPTIAAGPDLRTHGHLPADERAAIHRAVLREVVRPLAATLLGAPAAAGELRP